MTRKPWKSSGKDPAHELRTASAALGTPAWHGVAGRVNHCNSAGEGCVYRNLILLMTEMKSLIWRNERAALFRLAILPRHSSRICGLKPRTRCFVPQLIVLKRRLHGRVRLTNHDRWFFNPLYRWFPSILVRTILQPETLRALARAGFRCYWRWKSRPREGDRNRNGYARFILRMSLENPLWGAPRHPGELLSSGLEIAQSELPPVHGQTTGATQPRVRTFLLTHAPDIAGHGRFVVPTIGFDLLYPSSSSRLAAATSSGSTSQHRTAMVALK